MILYGMKRTAGKGSVSAKNMIRTLTESIIHTIEGYFVDTYNSNNVVISSHYQGAQQNEQHSRQGESFSELGERIPTHRNLAFVLNDISNQC